MSPEKRNALKRYTKVKTLAEAAEITPQYCSLIITGQKRASKFLAERLAAAANALTLKTDYFTPNDFRE